jgi:restriction system protein
MRELIKGWLGEKLTTFGMWMRLDSNTYRRVHNLIVPSVDGTTQIDHVLVSIYGIFVLETKNMDGWIFGSANQKTWTQSFFGKKFQFQNSLHQNYRHTRCLAEFLGLDHDLLHSVVLFIGDCKLKTKLPENVLTSGLSSYIRKFAKPVLTPACVTQIEQQLLALKAGRTASRSEHLGSLKRRFSARNAEKINA